MVEGAWRDAADAHVSRMALLCVENTHNYAGGTIQPLGALRATTSAAHERGMLVHMDGARLWHAHVATGVPLVEWAACVDTLQMCFSKGLGAPIGSILAGPADVIQRARRTRKRWGGGMRQVGILAAACLHALDHHVERLADDHARARRLAAGFSGAGVSVLEPETNIVFVTLDHPALDAADVLAGLESHGVRMGRYGARRLRAIVHLDVDDAAIERAIAVFRDTIEQRMGVLPARSG
jgi:threonine aldolase